MWVKEESEKVGLKLNIQKTKIMASGPITSWQIDGETMETVTDFFFLGSKITAVGDWSYEIKRCLLLEKKSYDKFRQCIEKQRHYFADKGPYTQSYHFSSSYVWMWELDHKEGWAPKNWCFWTVVFRTEKTLESSLDSKHIKPVHPKGNQPWILIRRTDAEAEAPILWPPDAESRLIGKDPDAGKDWSQKGMTRRYRVTLHSLSMGCTIVTSFWRVQYEKGKKITVKKADKYCLSQVIKVNKAIFIICILDIMWFLYKLPQNL